MQIKVDYIEGEEEDRIFLLPERARLRRLVTLEKQREVMGAGGPEAKIAELSAEILQSEIEADAACRTSGRLKTAIFEARRPKLGDRSAIRERFRFQSDPESDKPDYDESRAAEIAYELLNPAAVSGWEGEFDYELELVLADECLARIFPSFTERELFFTMRLRSDSPRTESPTPVI